jgi:hypothetical protein
VPSTPSKGVRNRPYTPMPRRSQPSSDGLNTLPPGLSGDRWVGRVVELLNDDPFNGHRSHRGDGRAGGKFREWAVAALALKPQMGQPS